MFRERGPGWQLRRGPSLACALMLDDELALLGQLVPMVRARRGSDCRRGSKIGRSFADNSGAGPWERIPEAPPESRPTPTDL